ncbi:MULTISPECIES: hypothetical protein [unclassified Salipiger]|uniref:hypothetical protein n=1 Tax=unclassified Salipiger TaxID=2640570 RepID=UPI0013B792F9|nr:MULTISPECIES: hypothetical protein [unclassified Salipiger]NDV49089.1 hypothetical protein [Salipiger sp. PrR003]NDW31348.1 hypothetical protein [Salipiger sp. PrR007]
MLKFIKTFRNDEDGAVTVDWVVLTAAVVAMAAGAYTLIDTQVDNALTRVGTNLTATTPVN